MGKSCVVNKTVAENIWQIFRKMGRTKETLGDGDSRKLVPKEDM